MLVTAAPGAFLNQLRLLLFLGDWGGTAGAWNTQAVTHPVCGHFCVKSRPRRIV
jgi:hypothetical protein